MAKQQKSVQGSFEQLREEIVHAIRASGLFGGSCYITNTLADHVTVCVWGSNDAPAHWRVPYDVGADGEISIGSPTRIKIVEVEVDVAEAAASEAAEGGEYADTAIDAKAGAGALQHKEWDFQVKSVADTEVNGVKGWTFEGYATVWNVVDRENDVTVKGCFSRWLQEHGLPVAKYEHGPTVGKYLEAKEDDHGLWLKGFIPEDPQTDLMHKLMKIGAVAKMSIGWRPYPGGMAKRADGVRELRDIMLPEASPVAVPMLPATSVFEVKSGSALPDAKFDERVEAATAALQEAVNDAGALLGRRVAQDRTPSVKSLDAVAALGVASGDAFVALLGVEVKAGRAISSVRKRYLADLVKAVSAIIDGLPDAERAEVEALISEDAAPKSDPVVDPVRLARQREAEIYAIKLKRYAPREAAAQEVTS